MKKITLILSSLLFAFILNAQQVAKEFVVVEIATGGWCQYCPGAAMGADDLMNNGHSVAIIENHNGDDYATDFSNGRNSFYAISGFPSAVFNGQNLVGGGSHTESMYSNYLPKYNNAIDDMTSFEVDLEIVSADDSNFSVTITINKVADYTGTDLVSHLVITQSHIEYSWQGMDEFNFVNVAMFPNQYGTSLDFSSENQIVLTYNFDVLPEWDLEECEIIAFVQDNNSKEILQGTKADMYISNGTNNVVLDEIIAPTEALICETTLSPIAVIKNKGTEPLTSLTMKYSINEGDIQTYEWTGNLAFAESEEIILDPILYSIQSYNTLEITALTPNGETDDDISNNTLSYDFNQAPQTTSRIFLEMNTGISFAQNISWQLENSTGNTLFSGNGYSSNEQINETFNLEVDDCYYFTVFNSYNNGFSTGGYFTLIDSEGTEHINVTGDFGSSQTSPFGVVTLASVTNMDTDKFVSVYPNPTTDLININLREKQNIDIKIYNITGKQIFENSYKNINNTNIDCSQFQNGIYFLEINNGISVISEKITVIK